MTLSIDVEPVELLEKKPPRSVAHRESLKGATPLDGAETDAEACGFGFAKSAL